MIWEKGGKGWVYVNTSTGKVALELTNAQYQDRARRLNNLKNQTANNTAEDLKEELQGTKKTYYDTKNILPGALDPFKNIDMNNVVKIVFVAVVGKMILNKIF